MTRRMVDSYAENGVDSEVEDLDVHARMKTCWLYAYRATIPHQIVFALTS
jgi:hypothetical protein